jgi:hypothetical protein
LSAQRSKQYLSPQEVSERYDGNISVRTLANWRTTGSGPKFIKLGGNIAYPIDKLVEWESAQTVQSTSEYKRSPSK